MMHNIITECSFQAKISKSVSQHLKRPICIYFRILAWLAWLLIIGPIHAGSWCMPVSLFLASWIPCNDSFLIRFPRCSQPIRNTDFRFMLDVWHGEMFTLSHDAIQSQVNHSLWSTLYPLFTRSFLKASIHLDN